jgi:hypothetical protein
MFIFLYKYRVDRFIFHHSLKARPLIGLQILISFIPGKFLQYC